MPVTVPMINGKFVTGKMKLTKSLEQTTSQFAWRTALFGLHQANRLGEREQSTSGAHNGVYGRLGRPNQQPPGPAYAHSPRPFRYPGRCLHVGGYAPRVCFCLSACTPRGAVLVWRDERHGGAPKFTLHLTSPSGAQRETARSSVALFACQGAQGYVV